MTYAPPSTTITLDAALRDLGRGNERSRARAAHALGDVVQAGDRDRALNALAHAVAEDPHPGVRTEAALSLGDLEREAAVPALIARLEDPVPAVRQAAAIALGRLGFASAFSALCEALDQGPPDLRFQAATSLAEIDPQRARVPLRRALTSESDGEVVSAVALALGAIEDRPSQTALAEALDHWSRPQTRFDIAYALADLGDIRATEVLMAFVDDKQNAWDAIAALQRLGDVRALAALTPVLARRFADFTLKLRAAEAVLALTAAKNPDSGPSNEIDSDNDGDNDSSAAAVAAQNVILAGLRARKREHRGLAIQIIENWGGSWAIPALRHLRQKRAARPFLQEIDSAMQALEAKGDNRTTR